MPSIPQASRARVAYGTTVPPTNRAIARTHTLMRIDSTTFQPAIAVKNGTNGGASRGTPAADARTKSFPNAERYRNIRTTNTRPVMIWDPTIPTRSPRPTFLTSPENDVAVIANQIE